MLPIPEEVVHVDGGQAQKQTSVQSHPVVSDRPCMAVSCRSSG
jgi:hypothetical protein